MLTGAAAMATGAALGGVLSGCGTESGSGGGEPSSPAKTGGEVTWSSPGNPGEAARLREYSSDYQAEYGTKITWQQTVGDYQTKILTQLVGGAAPDAFYVFDTQMVKMTDTGKLVDLRPYLERPDAAVKQDEFYPKLTEWMAPRTGEGVYGLVVDCNPKVFWFNQDLLAEAGVSQDPAAAFEAGSWNQNAVTDLLTKVKATGKRGHVFEATWFDLASWITTFGGTAFDEDGKAVFDTDPKALATLEWLFDQMASGNISYGGSLPKGQGSDALFYGGQLASLGYGRWVLPNLTKLKFRYDIAPLPSESGRDVAPVGVYCAAMSVNKSAKDSEAAQQFAARFCSVDGARARLSNGGNAVPAIKGLDDIATENSVPPHGAVFNQAVANGYAVPQVLARHPELAAELPITMDTLIKSGKETAKSFAEKLADMINTAKV
ncbi:MAG: extracellular solute-binding protein [Microlunatus sp.]